MLLSSVLAISGMEFINVCSMMVEQFSGDWPWKLGRLKVELVGSIHSKLQFTRYSNNPSILNL